LTFTGLLATRLLLDNKVCLLVADHEHVSGNVYASVDARYADANDLVTCATGRIMLIEIALNLITLSRRQSRHTLLTAFTTSAFVFWKTLWFLTLYIMPPPGNMSYFAEETTYLHLLLIFWIPNGLWVAVPFTVMVALWNKLALPVNRTQDYETIDRI
uniref:PhoLip_ATPase_C domain-containing protein n=1 Tax=Angiostrongylus cantonensis TaxID=6313 RepID=A0A0K0DQZ0_ANGCA